MALSALPVLLENFGIGSRQDRGPAWIALKVLLRPTLQTPFRSVCARKVTMGMQMAIFAMLALKTLSKTPRGLVSAHNVQIFHHHLMRASTC